MSLPHRSRHALAAAALALALAACGSGGDPAGSSSSTTTKGAASTSSSTSSSAGSSSTTSSSSHSPDPSVSVTAGTDRPQDAAQRRRGIAAADATAAATRLGIPAVGLSTPIEPQGLRGGKVNPKAGQVIWFTGYDRVRPGATGTTVIAGHVISGGSPDAFAALEQLSEGDGVVLTYPGGATLRFEVTSTRVVDKDELTTDRQVWGANEDTRRIVLVTCDDELGFRTDGHRKANFVAVAELPS